MKSLLIQSMILIVCITLFSCKIQEKITPLAEPITLAELQREQLEQEFLVQGKSNASSSTIDSIEFGEKGVYYLKVTYNIDEVDIFEIADIPNQFEKLANSFLGTLTRIVLGLTGSQDVDLSEYVIDLADLQFDSDIVRSIRIHKIFLKYSDEVERQSDFTADFNFVENLELAQPINLPGIGKGEKLLFSYRRRNNRCLYKCLEFEVHEQNLLILIEDQQKLTLRPLLSIRALPKVTDLKIQGQVELQIGIKLPF